MVGVGKYMGIGVGKESGMVESVKTQAWCMSGSHHFMTWRVGFQVRIDIFLSLWNVDVKCKHCMCT